MTTFGWRISILTAVLSLVVLLPQGASTQQDVNALKKGVVRIRNTKHEEIGTGIIVKVNRDGVYVVTAAHVVRGDASPEVYLFTRQREPLRAMLINMEEDDRKGLALLWLKVDAQTLAGLKALSLGSSSGLDGGEEVSLLGFPDGTSIWTVTRGTVARREGREVVFSGPVATGNSGGPLLHGGRVVGLVTDKGPTFSYAAQAESVALYLRGIDPELADLSAKPTPTPAPRATPKPTPTPTPADDDEFCRALATLVAASKNNFESIKGARAETHFHATLKVPGTLNGYVRGNEEAYYYVQVDVDKQKVEAEFNGVVSKLKQCLSLWESKQVSDEYKQHKFRERRNGTVITVRYNLKPQYKEKYYYLTLITYPPNNSEW